MYKLRCRNKECRDKLEESECEAQFIISSVEVNDEGQIQQLNETDASDFECRDCCGKAEWIEVEDDTPDSEGTRTGV